MTPRTLPTTEGLWWADVDGDRRVLKVWGLDVLRFSPRHGVVWSVDDERLVEGLDGWDVSDGERIPSVKWVAPATPPEEVAALRGERDALAETLELSLSDVEAQRRVIMQACEALGVTEDDENDWPKLGYSAEFCVRERNELRAERDAAVAETARLRSLLGRIADAFDGAHDDDEVFDTMSDAIANFCAHEFGVHDEDEHPWHDSAVAIRTAAGLPEAEARAVVEAVER